MRIRQVFRETFNRERAQVLLEQTAEILHAIGGADRLQRHVRLDLLVHRNRVEIDMQDVAADRGVLHFLDEREAVGPINLQLHENVLAGGMAQHRGDLASRDLQGFRLGLCPVNDGRDGAFCLEFPHRGAAEGRPALRREFHLFCHDAV